MESCPQVDLDVRISNPRSDFEVSLIGGLFLLTFDPDFLPKFHSDPNLWADTDPRTGHPYK